VTALNASRRNPGPKRGVGARELRAVNILTGLRGRSRSSEKTNSQQSRVKNNAKS
jgi:hypothetical protein